MNFDLNSTLQGADVSVCGRVVISNTSGPGIDLSLCYFSPSLLTNRNAIVQCLESENLQRQLIGPQGG